MSGAWRGAKTHTRHSPFSTWHQIQPPPHSPSPFAALATRLVSVAPTTPHPAHRARHSGTLSTRITPPCEMVGAIERPGTTATDTSALRAISASGTGASAAPSASASPATFATLY